MKTIILKTFDDLSDERKTQAHLYKKMLDSKGVKFPENFAHLNAVLYMLEYEGDTNPFSPAVITYVRGIINEGIRIINLMDDDLRKEFEELYKAI